jgi:tetratricopeptide (TPR) repeat protein
LTRAGRPEEGLRWARRALKLGWQDPAALYHAGMAAQAAGERGDAVSFLESALERNPDFSPVRAPAARAALEELR